LTNETTTKQMNKFIDKWMNENTNEWMDKWMNFFTLEEKEWVDEWMN